MKKKLVNAYLFVKDAAVCLLLNTAQLVLLAAVCILKWRLGLKDGGKAGNENWGDPARPAYLKKPAFRPLADASDKGVEVR